MKLKNKIDWNLVISHTAKCKVNCDDFHNHTALNECITGPEDSLLISKLYEYILIIETKLSEIERLSKIE